MSNKVPTNKPFNLVDRKSGPKNTVSETDICQFTQVITSNIKQSPDWKPFSAPTAVWKSSRTPDRGFTGADASTKAAAVDGMLGYISSYAPKHLLREITERSTSLKEVWALPRKWAGLQPTGLKILEYSRLQTSWDPAGEMSPSEYYYALLDTMQDVLLVKDGKVKFDDKTVTETEDMSPTLKSTIVKDWLVAMGGQALFEHTCRVYAKELETCTLADIQHRIAQNLDNLNTEIEATAGAVHAYKVFTTQRGRRGNRFQQNSSFSRSRGASTSALRAPAPSKPPFTKKKVPPTKVCILCKALKRTNNMNTHTLANCFMVDRQDREEIANIHLSVVSQDDDPDNDQDGHFSSEESSPEIED